MGNGASTYLLTVSGDGTKDYTTIAGAMAQAETLNPSANPVAIYIYPGIYNEAIDIDSNNISIVADVPGSVTVTSVGNILNVAANLAGINITGLKLLQPSPEQRGRCLYI